MLRLSWLRRLSPCLFVIPALAHAGFASSPASVPLTALASPSFASQLAQVVVSLVLVLGVIVAAAWAMRRFSMVPMATGSRLRVVSGVMVGPKERVVVVEIEDTWLVVGVTAQAVNLLHELPKPPSAVAAAQPAMPAFAERLAQVLGKRLQKRDGSA